MARSISGLSGSMARLEEDGKQFLAIATGIRTKSFAVTRFTEVKKHPGWIFRGDSAEPWRIQGFLDYEGQLYLYGEYLEGRPLMDVLSGSERDVLTRLARLAELFSLLRKRGIEYTSIHAGSILVLADGGVLVLPAQLTDRIRTSQTLQNRLRSYELFNHPDLSGEENLSFAFAVLAYRVLTGDFPFFDDREEELHNKMRRRKILAPDAKEPTIRPEVSAQIMAGLRQEKRPAPTLEDWRLALLDWARSGVRRTLNDGEREALVRRGEAEEARYVRTYGRAQFLQKHGRTLAIVAVAVGFGGWLIGSILSNVFAPRVTEGFSPEDVVQAFYTSINDLDHMTMEDCVIGDAGRATIREAMNLFVITRQRFGVEGTTGLVDADEWAQEGYPELDPQFAPYGVARLSITEESDGNEPVFTVEYQKWAPSTGDLEELEEQAPVRLGYEGEWRRERVRLSRDKDDWVIYRFETLDTERLDVQYLRTEFDAG